jgi:glutamine amidotransferase/cyclase
MCSLCPSLPPSLSLPAACLPCCLQVLQSASERVFVPLTVGGGIRGFTAGGQTYPALQVASEYFR